MEDNKNSNVVDLKAFKAKQQGLKSRVGKAREQRHLKTEDLSPEQERSLRIKLTLENINRMLEHLRQSAIKQGLLKDRNGERP